MKLNDEHPVSKYLGAKCAVLQLFGIFAETYSDPAYDRTVVELRHKQTGVGAGFSITSLFLASGTPEELKSYIDSMLQDSLFLIQKEIEKCEFPKDIMLPANQGKSVSGNGYWSHALTDPTETHTLTIEKFKEAYKSILNDELEYKVHYDGAAAWPSKKKTGGASQTLGTLQKSFELKQDVACKRCNRGHTSINKAVVHMNDVCGMTREEIADYLESQDLDLTMKPLASTGGE